MGLSENDIVRIWWLLVGVIVSGDIVRKYKWYFKLVLWCEWCGFIRVCDEELLCMWMENLLDCEGGEVM